MRVVAVTGGRSDFGLFYWTLRELDLAPDFDLTLIVTGSHLCDALGKTENEISLGPNSRVLKVPIIEAEDSPAAVGRAFAKAVGAVSEALADVRPELVLLLGDRYETLAAGTAATIHAIPIAHIHGGEVTEGALDDSFRHALTKLASLHFVTAPVHRKRVIQMGEHPDFVHLVGSPGLETLRRTVPLSPAELETAFRFCWKGNRLAVVTYHPATRDPGHAAAEVGAMLSALGSFRALSLVISAPNADAGGPSLLPALEAFAAQNAHRTLFRPSFGSQIYLSFLRCADVVVGNSSSGIIEAPSVGVPTVDIGTRQRGRLRAESVISCAAEAPAIGEALDRALSPDFKKFARTVENPYGDGDFSRKIVPIIRRTDLVRLKAKRFYDL